MTRVDTRRRRRSSAAAGAVVLVHGVAFGPETLAPLARQLGREALVLERRGYGSRARLAPASSVEDHVDDLIAMLDRARIKRAVVAGASGGATVALAAALLAPARVRAAVCHEPAVGSLAPELQALVRGALRRGRGMALARALAGPDLWANLDAAHRDRLRVRSEFFAADAQAFLDWEPPFGGRPSTRVVLTVGRRSSPLRHAIAARLGDRLRGRVVVLGGCGHLPQVEAPGRFGAVIHHAGLDLVSDQGRSDLDRPAIVAAPRRP